ncbi:MAG: VOC family protein [Gemmatimonadaceae bacterium]
MTSAPLTPAAAAADLSSARVGQIAVTVRDLDGAIAFYRDTLGLPFLFQVPRMAFFDCGGVRLLLGLAEKPGEAHGSSIIYYKVGDIHAAHETLAGRGVRFEGKPHHVAKMPDHDLWLAFLRDADDNVLALMSEVRDPDTRSASGAAPAG